MKINKKLSKQIEKELKKLPPPKSEDDRLQLYDTICTKLAKNKPELFSLNHPVEAIYLTYAKAT